MQKFKIKTVGKTQFFELDESRNKLSIITRKWGKKDSRQEFDLQNYHPDFGEIVPEKSRLFPLILSWCVVVLGGSLFGFVFICTMINVLFYKSGDFQSASIFLLAILLGPIPFFWQSLRYIFKERPLEQTGVFYFECLENDEHIKIEYLLKSRKYVLEMVKKISGLCRTPEKKPQDEKRISACQFKNVYAELFPEEIRFFNEFGVKINTVSCRELLPEIIHEEKHYKIRNLICGIFAWLLWLSPLLFAIYGWILEGWIIGSAILVCCLLPGAVGAYIWKLRRADVNVYCLQWEAGYEDIILSVLPGKAEETAYFIKKLQKQLTLAQETGSDE